MTSNDWYDYGAKIGELVQSAIDFSDISASEAMPARVDVLAIDIEDSLDWEGIMEVKDLHDKRFLQGTQLLKEQLEDLLPLGDGSCTRCKVCAYPDQPCRFPELASASMEAFGLYVADVCKKNQIDYNYGPGKMCYTGCYLFER